MVCHMKVDIIAPQTPNPPHLLVPDQKEPLPHIVSLQGELYSLIMLLGACPKGVLSPRPGFSTSLDLRSLLPLLSMMTFMYEFSYLT